MVQPVEDENYFSFRRDSDVSSRLAEDHGAIAIQEGALRVHPEAHHTHGERLHQDAEEGGSWHRSSSRDDAR